MNARRAIAISSAADNRLIVFSDLDGSLLDHDTYDWQPARPALDAIGRRNIPLVLVSSKTLAELEEYRRQLDLEHPVVAENGAVVDVPEGYFASVATIADGSISRAELQGAYEDVKFANGFKCEAFYELGIPGIMRETGLSERQATRANDRQASEPVLWLDDDERAAEFERAMKQRGLRCTRGGRFLHLMGNTGKDEAVQRLLQAYRQHWSSATVTSVSLGDGPNDLGMLAATDIAVIIPGKHRHRMQLKSKNRVIEATSHGPAGWNEAVLALLAERNDNLAATPAGGV